MNSGDEISKIIDQAVLEQSTQAQRTELKASGMKCPKCDAWWYPWKPCCTSSYSKEALIVDSALERV